MVTKGVVYIVRLSVPLADFRDRLRALSGAVLIQELPAGRAVVLLSSASALPRLAQMEGVEGVDPDRLERPL